MKKKILVFLLAMLVAMAGFAGCGGSTDSGDSDGSDAGSEDLYADYPKAPIKVIVPWAAGGGTDVMVRTIANYLDLGQPLVVSNIEGGGTSIGTMEALNSKPDGYTIHCNLPESMMANHLAGNIPEQVHDKFIMIANIVTDSVGLCAAKNSPFNTLEDVAAYAKEHPGELKLASTGAKGAHEQAKMSFCKMADIKITYVPYSTPEARTAVMGGHADLLWLNISEMKFLIDSGDLKPIAVAAEKRSKLLPDTPTFKESGYNLVHGMHRSFMAPPGTPEEIIIKLQDAFLSLEGNQEFTESMENELAFELDFQTGEELGEFVEARWPIAQEFAALLGEDY